MSKSLWVMLLIGGIALTSAATTQVDAPKSTVGLMLSSKTAWLEWLASNFPLKSAVSKEQESALKSFSGGQWDDRFIGAIYGDGTPGAILTKFSPSGKTLVRFIVLRWSKDGWKPMIRCGQKKVVYAQRPPITSTESVDVYQVYLQRRSSGLGFMITLGNVGDKLFGDAISLIYDAGAQNYAEPDDTDHD